MTGQEIPAPPRRGNLLAQKFAAILVHLSCLRSGPLRALPRIADTGATGLPRPKAPEASSPALGQSTRWPAVVTRRSGMRAALTCARNSSPGQSAQAACYARYGSRCDAPHGPGRCLRPRARRCPKLTGNTSFRSRRSAFAHSRTHHVQWYDLSHRRRVRADRDVEGSSDTAATEPAEARTRPRSQPVHAARHSLYRKVSAQ